jgi:hypothetical protein
MQAALAYMDTPLPDKPSAISPALDLSGASSPLPVSNNSVFPDLSRGRSTIASTISPQDHHSPVKFYQVYLDMQAFVASPCSPGETAQLYFALYSKPEAKFLTEDFCAILNHNGVLAREEAGGIGRIKTLFIDLSPHDVQGAIYLVCRIVRFGAMKLGQIEDRRRGSGSDPLLRDPYREGSRPTASTWSETESALNGTESNFPVGSDSHFKFRRPFGCAVLELTELEHLVTDQGDASALKEHTMPIFVPVSEDSFSTLHQDLIEGRTKEFEKSSR